MLAIAAALFSGRALPVPELKLDAAKGEVSCRWGADEPGFNMPVRVGVKGDWRLVRPTAVCRPRPGHASTA